MDEKSFSCNRILHRNMKFTILLQNDKFYYICIYLYSNITKLVTIKKIFSNIKVKKIKQELKNTTYVFQATFLLIQYKLK